MEQFSSSGSPPKRQTASKSPSKRSRDKSSLGKDDVKKLSLKDSSPFSKEATSSGPQPSLGPISPFQSISGSQSSFEPLSTSQQDKSSNLVESQHAKTHRSSTLSLRTAIERIQSELPSTSTSTSKSLSKSSSKPPSSSLPAPVYPQTPRSNRPQIITDNLSSSPWIPPLGSQFRDISIPQPGPTRAQPVLDAESRVALSGFAHDPPIKPSSDWVERQQRAAQTEREQKSQERITAARLRTLAEIQARQIVSISLLSDDDEEQQEEEEEEKEEEEDDEDDEE